jgi:hypothetical protein
MLLRPCAHCVGPLQPVHAPSCKTDHNMLASTKTRPPSPRLSHENCLVAALRTAGVSASRNPAVVGSAFAVQHAPVGVAARKASTPLSIKMMSGQITMPALSSTMKEGKIVQWTKSVGDK